MLYVKTSSAYRKTKMASHTCSERAGDHCLTYDFNCLAVIHRMFVKLSEASTPVRNSEYFSAYTCFSNVHFS